MLTNNIKPPTTKTKISKQYLRLLVFLIVVVCKLFLDVLFLSDLPSVEAHHRLQVHESNLKHLEFVPLFLKFLFCSVCSHCRLFDRTSFKQLTKQGGFLACFSALSTSDTAPIQRPMSPDICSISRPTENPFLIASKALLATPTANDMVTGSIIGLH